MIVTVLNQDVMHKICRISTQAPTQETNVTDSGEVVIATPSKLYFLTEREVLFVAPIQESNPLASGELV